MDIQTHILALARARAARIEWACERALQGGEHGVLVDGDRIGPHVSVPCGQIYYLPPRLDDA